LAEYPELSRLRSSKPSAWLVSVCVVVAIFIPLEGFEGLKLGGALVMYLFIAMILGTGNNRELGGWPGRETTNALPRQANKACT
jgi:hypothetical protein